MATSPRSSCIKRSAWILPLSKSLEPALCDERGATYGETDSQPAANAAANLHCPCCARSAPFSHSVLLLQAVRVGSAAVAVQCRAVDAWAARVGARKRPVASADADAMAALQERIAGMAAGEIEDAYRSIQGARPGRPALG